MWFLKIKQKLYRSSWQLWLYECKVLGYRRASEIHHRCTVCLIHGYYRSLPDGGRVLFCICPSVGPSHKMVSIDISIYFVQRTITIQYSDKRTGQQGIWRALTVARCNQTVIKQYKLHTTSYTKHKLIDAVH